MPCRACWALKSIPRIGYGYSIRCAWPEHSNSCILLWPCACVPFSSPFSIAFLKGKVAGADALPGSIKLAIYDSISGDLIQMYRFPPDQASLSNSFLNDIMVDHKAGVAYISDSGLPSQTTLPTSFLV